MELSGTLDESLHVGLLHRLADLPMDDIAAASIEEGAEVVEGAWDVEVGDILYTGSYASGHEALEVARSPSPSSSAYGSTGRDGQPC